MQQYEDQSQDVAAVGGEHAGDVGGGTGGSGPGAGEPVVGMNGGSMQGGVGSTGLVVSGNGTSAERPDSDDEYDAEVSNPGSTTNDTLCTVNLLYHMIRILT